MAQRVVQSCDKAYHIFQICKFGCMTDDAKREGRKRLLFRCASGRQNTVTLLQEISLLTCAAASGVDPLLSRPLRRMGMTVRKKE